MSSRLQDTDRLSPTAVDPTMRYVDRDDKGKELWRVNIRCFHDRLSTLSRTEKYQLPDVSRHTPYESLDELVETVRTSRLRGGAPRISTRDADKQKYLIAHSATNQSDLIASVEASPTLLGLIQQKRRGIKKQQVEAQLQTQHILLKNGIRAKYKTPDGVVDLRDSISGSWDRESPRLQMARRIAPARDGQANPEAPSDFYTGRPDTPAKAREMAEMVFLGELHVPKGQRKGVVKEEIDGTYTLRVVVNSLESTSPLYALARPGDDNEGGTEQEQEYLEAEVRALRELEEQTKDKPLKIKDPVTGKWYKVKVEPILIDMQVNVMGRLEKAFSSPASGEQRAMQISRDGWARLKVHAEEKLAKLGEALENERNQESKKAKEIKQKMERIKTLIKLLDTSLRGFTERLHPAKELLCYSMLCRLIDIPQLIHCKSSTDRTSFGIITSTLRQWENLQLPIPDDIISLLDDELFKELFAANWNASHAITRNARGPQGVLHKRDGSEVVLDHDTLGIATNNGISECVLTASLLPKRYLKDYGLYKAVFDKSIMLSTLFCIGVGIASLLRGAVSFFEVFNPFAPDLFPKAPENRVGRFFAIVLGSLVIGLPMRILFEHFRPNTTFWYGTIRPPENRLGRILGSIFLMPFMLTWRIITPIFTWVRMIPSQIIDTEKDFIKKRRLISSEKGYQGQFKKAGKAVPAKAATVSEYNELFRQRFMNPIRPAQMHIHADTVQAAISARRTSLSRDLRTDASLITADQIEAAEIEQFKKDFPRIRMTIDGKTYPRSPAGVDKALKYLRRRCTNSDGMLNQQQWLSCLAMLHQGSLVDTKRHTEAMLMYGELGGESTIYPGQDQVESTREPVCFSVTTTGDWSIETRMRWDLYMGENHHPHAQIYSTTSTNLKSGRAHIAWTVKKGSNGKPFFRPFKETDGIAPEEMDEPRESPRAERADERRSLPAASEADVRIDERRGPPRHLPSTARVAASRPLPTASDDKSSVDRRGSSGTTRAAKQRRSTPRDRDSLLTGREQRFIARRRQRKTRFQQSRLATAQANP